MFFVVRRICAQSMRGMVRPAARTYRWVNSGGHPPAELRIEKRAKGNHATHYFPLIELEQAQQYLSDVPMNHKLDWIMFGGECILACHCAISASYGSGI